MKPPKPTRVPRKRKSFCSPCYVPVPLKEVANLVKVGKGPKPKALEINKEMGTKGKKQPRRSNHVAHYTTCLLKALVRMGTEKTRTAKRRPRNDNMEVGESSVLAFIALGLAVGAATLAIDHIEVRRELAQLRQEMTEIRTTVEQLRHEPRQQQQQQRPFFELNLESNITDSFRPFG